CPCAQRPVAVMPDQRGFVEHEAAAVPGQPVSELHVLLPRETGVEGGDASTPRLRLAPGPIELSLRTNRIAIGPGSVASCSAGVTPPSSTTITPNAVKCWAARAFSVTANWSGRSRVGITTSTSGPAWPGELLMSLTPRVLKPHCALPRDRCLQ